MKKREFVTAFMELFRYLQGRVDVDDRDVADLRKLIDRLIARRKAPTATKRAGAQ